MAVVSCVCLHVNSLRRKALTTSIPEDCCCRPFYLLWWTSDLKSTQPKGQTRNLLKLRLLELGITIYIIYVYIYIYGEREREG